MKTPVISVCLLAHNSARYIAMAVHSVLAQTFTDWEMLICDDASSDETGKIAEGYLQDSRIRYLRHRENLGQAGNWRYAIEKSSALIIATLHADDVWESGTLAHFVSCFTCDQGIDVVWGRWLRTNKELRPLAYQLPACNDRLFSGFEAVAYLLRTRLCLPSVLAFHKRVVDRAGLPNANYDALCDMEYVLRLCKHAVYARASPCLLTRYRLHEDSLTTAYHNGDEYVRELDRFQTYLSELLEGVPAREKLVEENNLRIAEWNFRVAMSLKIDGKATEAGQRLRKAFILNPWLLTQWRFLVKWILFHTGRCGKIALARIHGRNKWVTQE